MKTTKNIKSVIVALTMTAAALVVLNAGGGNLEPSSPPGPTGHTLEEIYNAVQNLQPQTPAAGFYAYLHIEEVSGESTDPAHLGWIEVESFSWGHGRSGFYAVTDDIVIVHRFDKASPQLALLCCTGQRIDQVTLEVCRPEIPNQRFMRYRLRDVIITNIKGRTQSSPKLLTPAPLPMEEVSLNFKKIEWTYYDVNSIPTTTSWNFETSNPI